MGTPRCQKLLNQTHWVQAIHTAVKGRARYKVNGLYHSEALKKYLESRLLEDKIISQVRANSYTGNLLVIFNPDESLNANAVSEACPTGQGGSSLRDAARTTIALLIQEIVLDYRKKVSKSIGTSNLHSFGTKENIALVADSNRNISDSAALPQISMQRQLNRQLIPVVGAVGTLVCATGLLYAYNLDEAILLLIQRLHTP
ncbi:PA-phosphatase, partial [Nostoc sp. UCD122]|nr:PA-phosphatase [Nostoc sp. UCD122]